VTVAVLFARQDSCYKQLPECDVYDIDRDARTWAGGTPIVAHPPCRSWSRMRTFAKPRVDEKALAPFAVDCVRRFGGVVEHPHGSALWPTLGLPRPGEPADEFGGWTLCVDQFWWGHRARKRTLLYIVGVAPRDLPAMPLQLGEAPAVVGLWSGRDRSRARPGLSLAEREHSPPAFAAWLVDLAQRARARVGALS
jgi:hypothetical protein